MNKSMIGILTVFLFLVAASHVSYAEQCGCAGYPGRAGQGGGMSMTRWTMHHGPGFTDGSGRFLWQKLKRLDLSDKQKDALKAIRSKVTKDTIKKRADLELARVDLRELLHKDPVDMSAVEASLKKAESVRTDLKLTHIKAMEEIKSILTPEQRKKLKEDIKAGFLMHERRYGGRHESMPLVRKDEAQHGTEEN